MNESTRIKMMSAKHPPIHQEPMNVRVNKETQMRMRKVTLMTQKVEKRLGFMVDKKHVGLQQKNNSYVTSNTGVRIDNNDLEGTAMLSEIIRIMGDIPYEQKIEE